MAEPRRGGINYDRRAEVGATPIDWSKDGVLWLINASVFHPRGFALAIDTQTREPLLLGDGSEAWYFEPEDVPTPDQLKEAVEALFARARTAKEQPDA